MASTDRRTIPEATVARLPLYLRSLVEGQHAGLTTISSERLAELAGVNAAKVRKDLSYLGSYGTRGVGYDVEYLLFQMSRELGPHPGLAGRHRRARQPRPGARELRRVRRAGLPGGGPVRRRPASHRHRGARHDRPRRSTSSPTIAAERSIAIAIIATPASAAQDVADRLVAAGVPVDPQLRAHGDLGPRGRVAAQGRPRRRAADPQLLPAAQGRRSARRPSLTERRARRRPSVPREPARGGPAGARRRRRRGGRREGSRPARRRRGRARRGDRGRRRRCAPSTSPGRSGRTRAAMSSGTASPSPCTDDPAANQAVFDDGEAAGVWVNAADDPARCSYTLPARLDRGRLLVTVSTVGHSPALASWLRDQLAEQLGPEYDILVDLLAEARAEPGGGRSRRPSAPIGDPPSIRGCWTSSGPVVSTRPGSSSRLPSPPPIRPSRVPFARRPSRVRRRHRAEPPEHTARPARAGDHR